MSSEQQIRRELIKAGSNEVEFLVFNLGTQKYGMNVAKVRQIMVFDRSKISEVPNQLPEYVGLMPFRESTIAVVDLRIHLKKAAANQTTPDLLIISEFNRRIVGFVVDGVDKIERCSWETFQPIGDSACNADDSKTVGVVRLKDNIILILDLETIMGLIDPSMNVNIMEQSIPLSTIDRSTVTILHCDDSSVVQKVLLKTLEASGFKRFVQFSSAVEALNYLSTNRQNNKVDVILSDIEMPQMDGLAFCKKIKEDSEWKKLPFLFFSSTVDPQMEAKCISVGSDGAFAKPEISIVIESIDRLVSERRNSSN